MRRVSDGALGYVPGAYVQVSAVQISESEEDRGERGPGEDLAASSPQPTPEPEPEHRGYASGACIVETEPEVDMVWLASTRALHAAVIMNDPAEIRRLLKPEQRAAAIVPATKKSLKSLTALVIPALEKKQAECMQNDLPKARQAKKTAEALHLRIEGQWNLLQKQIQVQNQQLEVLVKAAGLESGGKVQQKVTVQHQTVRGAMETCIFVHCSRSQFSAFAVAHANAGHDQT